MYRNEPPTTRGREQLGTTRFLPELLFACFVAILVWAILWPLV